MEPDGLHHHSQFPSSASPSPREERIGPDPLDNIESSSMASSNSFLSVNNALSSDQSLLQPGAIVTQLANEIPGTIQRLHSVGGGGGGDLFTGEWTTPSGEVRKVALKYMRTTRNEPEELSRIRRDKHLLREATVWQRSVHRNILPFYGIQLGDPACLVSPWCATGDIDSYIKKNPKTAKQERMALLMQTGRGIEYLHGLSPPIAHGDIKPQNVLIQDNQEAGLADFGLARVLDGLYTGLTTSTTNQGTPAYMAPEVHTRDGCRAELPADVWAFACLILAVRSGKAPFYNLSWFAVIKAVASGKLPNPEDHGDLPKDDALWPLMFKCWNFDPARRPTIKEVLQELAAAMD